MPRYLIFLIIFCGSISKLHSQVTIAGEVAYNGAPLNGVMIQVYKKAKIQKTVAANKRGRYEIEFDYGQQYLLIFRASYMIPIKILINTELEDEALSQMKIDVPLNMELYKRFKGMDISAYNDAIGQVLNTGSGVEAFSFVPNAEVLARVKKVNLESKRREANGELAVDVIESEVITDEMKTLKPKNESIKSSEEATKVIEASKEEMEAVEKLESKTIVWFETIEKAEDEKVEYNQMKQNQYSEQVTDQKAIESDFIYDNKTIRKESAESADQQRSDLIDIRVKKQQYKDELLMMKIENSTKLGPRLSDDYILVDRQVDDGTFSDEEILVIRQGPQLNTYKMVTQNWLFFDVTYYYKNGSEISEDEYIRVKHAVE